LGIVRQGLVPATYNGLSGEDVGQIFFTQNLDLHHENGGDFFILTKDNGKNTLHNLSFLSESKRNIAHTINKFNTFN